MEKQTIQNSINALVGSRVRARREYLNVSQDELGERLHTTRSNISRKERGSIPFTIEEIIETASFLNCTVSFLLDIEDEHDLADPTIGAYYRGLPPDKQSMIRAMMRAAHEEAKKSETTHGRKAE